MHKHYVCFLSPGILFSEQAHREISAWVPSIAVEMARDIVERYGARPYGFYFYTQSRTDDELSFSESGRSGMYYLGGTVYTLDEIKAQNDPENKILISNMECNGYSRVIENRNSYRFTAPFGDNDTLLDVDITATVNA